MRRVIRSISGLLAIGLVATAADARFLQTDPVGYKDGPNWYDYVHEDPLNNTDPTGLFLLPWEKAVTVTGGTAAQRAHYDNVVRRVLSSPRGQEMLSKINGPWFRHGNPQTIRLEPGIGAGTQATLAPNSSNRVVSWDVVRIDPDFHPAISTTNGIEPASDEHITAHELGHSVFGAQDDGRDSMRNIRENENPVAKSLGQSERNKAGSPSPASLPLGSKVELHGCTGSHIERGSPC